MRFEIYNTIGKVVMWTESQECIPPIDELKVMASANYHYKIDGKSVSYKEVCKLLESMKNTACADSKLTKKVRPAYCPKPTTKQKKLF